MKSKEELKSKLYKFKYLDIFEILLLFNMQVYKQVLKN